MNNVNREHIAEVKENEENQKSLPEEKKEV